MPNQTHQHVATSAGIPFTEETMRARLAVVGLAGFAIATFVCGFPLLVRPQACSEIVRNGSPGDQLLLVCRSTAMTLGMYVTFALVRALITAFLEQSPIDTTDSVGPTNRINRLVRVAFQSALITAVATAPAVATPTRLNRPQKVNSVTIDTKPHDSVLGDSVLVESVPVEQVSVVSVSVDASGQRWPVFGATRPPLTGVPRQPTPGSKIPTFGPPYVPTTATVEEPSTTSLATTSPATTSPTTTAPSTTSPTTTSPAASVVNTTLPIAATPTSASAPSAQSASTDQVRPGTWVVKGGESFWSIAEQLARTSNQQAAAQTVGSIWTQLIEYNRANLPVPGLPDLLYPGHVLVVPPDVLRD